MPMSPLLCAALIGRVPLTAVAAGFLAIQLPPVAVAVAAVGAIRWWSRRRRLRPEPIDEAAICSAVASELRAGTSLRQSLAAAADRSPEPRMVAPVRLALAGAPAAAVAARLESALPANGRHIGVAFQLAAETGAGAVPVFQRLAERAGRVAEISRERAVLTAQAKLSAAVVGGAPVAVVVVLLASGRAAVLTEGGSVGLMVGVVGVGLVASGLAVVWVMLRRSAR